LLQINQLIKRLLLLHLLKILMH